MALCPSLGILAIAAAGDSNCNITLYVVISIPPVPLDSVCVGGVWSTGADDGGAAADWLGSGNVVVHVCVCGEGCLARYTLCP